MSAMCETCEQAVVDHGLGSPIANAIHMLLHPWTREQWEEHDRAMAGLVRYLNACDETES